MKRVLLVLLGCGLAATWIGCQGAADSATSDYTLVKLKLPHMT